eukprot:2955126-Pyramimonas_sp.AAC.1
MPALPASDWSTELIGRLYLPTRAQSGEEGRRSALEGGLLGTGGEMGQPDAGVRLCEAAPGDPLAANARRWPSAKGGGGGEEGLRLAARQRALPPGANNSD